jgi:DNA recombination protein RmuC
MGDMDPLVIVVLVAVAVLGALAGAVLSRSVGNRAGSLQTEAPVDTVAPATTAAISATVSEALATLQQQAAADRDAAVQAALQQAAILQREQLDQASVHQRQLLDQAGVLQREQLGAHLAAGQRELSAKKDVIDTRLDQAQAEMRAEMHRLAQLVGQLGQRSAEQFGKVDESLRTQAEITQALSASTQSLREVLANPKARGQWGERMAEDVLRLAGLVEHVNYERQTAVEGTRALPDYTFVMPKGHVLYMDVKFPLNAYLRYQEAATDAERQAHREAFLRDVRSRVRELSQRDYAAIGERPTVDYVLLFLPNEAIAGFIHEHDPNLLDLAMGQKVVLCSPLTLFAFLGVIRQAYDNFVIEQTSDEILKLLGKFGQQWEKYKDSLVSVQRKFEAVSRELEQLNGTRRRQLERPLAQLNELRRQRGLEIDAELPDAELIDADVLELGFRDDVGA